MGLDFIPSTAYKFGTSPTSNPVVSGAGNPEGVSGNTPRYPNDPMPYVCSGVCNAQYTLTISGIALDLGRCLSRSSGGSTDYRLDTGNINGTHVVTPINPGCNLSLVTFGGGTYTHYTSIGGLCNLGGSSQTYHYELYFIGTTTSCTYNVVRIILRSDFDGTSLGFGYESALPNSHIFGETVNNQITSYDANYNMSGTRSVGIGGNFKVE